LVENNLTKKKHAVKAFSKDYLSTQHKGKESLINEISIMRELNHPNIMRLEEIHESQNSIYLIIELLEGGELLTTIVEKHTLKLPELGKVLRDVLAGLAYIDKCGIMHRDLKPENLILKNKGGKLSL
jgi:serine/threonine protein kinase